MPRAWTDDVHILLRDRDGVLVGVAAIDRTDCALSAHRWYLSQGYVRRSTSSGSRALHREVLGLPTGSTSEVDHIDGDPLNNRRANLRVCTREQNAQNVKSRAGSSSMYRGVSWESARGKWRATVGPRIIGRFDSELQAATVASAVRAQHMPYSNEERFA